jgi:excisionase family DNA binding protein
MQPTHSWLSVEEIAQHLGVSKETIYRWLERGTIPAHRIGKLWKFKPADVDKWVTNGGADLTDSKAARVLKKTRKVK